MKPQIICLSLQFSCCFFLAFLAMLCVPWMYKHKAEFPFFFTLGMITMYFDFYTTPLLVVGYPLLFYLLLLKKDGQTITLKKTFAYLLTWVIGYGLMWVSKLALTTLFTPVNGFKNGFDSFATRVGIVKDQNYLDYYDGAKALEQIWNKIVPDKETLAFVMVSVAVMLVAVIVAISKDRSKMRYIWKHLPFLLPTAVMLVWYVLAAEPTIIHSWFQYRTIAIMYWGVFLYVSFFFEKTLLFRMNTGGEPHENRTGIGNLSKTKP